MKKLLLASVSTIFVLLMVTAQAGTANSLTGNTALDKEIRDLQHEWAKIKYTVKNEDQQEKQIGLLATRAADVTAHYPGYAEPKIWEAIIVSTQAGIKGGLGALSLVKRSRALLEQAEKIKADALQGSVYTSLGSLYYQVPGWPIGFGDNDKARSYLQRARAINPNGIDPNYFYGDFLIEQNQNAEAIKVLEQALRAPARPDRPVADWGRREEIKQDIARAKRNLEDS